jgi:threonine/homoserine/homoserine lactone efflux protein
MEALGASELIAFNAALLVAVLGPGPAFLLCVQAALRGGRREGVLTGAGLAAMAALWTLAALLGLETLFAVAPAAYTVLKVGGALIVLGFAVQTWRSADAPVAHDVPTSKRRAFAAGFALNLGNPKSVLFSAGVLIVIFPPSLGAAEIALVTVNHFLLELAVYVALAMLLDRPAVQRRYLAFKPTFSKATAVVLGALGINLLVAA